MHRQIDAFRERLFHAKYMHGSIRLKILIGKVVSQVPAKFLESGEMAFAAAAVQRQQRHGLGIFFLFLPVLV